MAGKYSALVGGGAYAGIDQGIDFTGGPFPIFALGPGKVERSMASGSGWPGVGALIVYVLTGGPLKGKRVYVAEDLIPSVKVGDTITQGQVIGAATGSGQAPGIEAGFADASGRAFGSPTGGPQPTGKQFEQAVRVLSLNGGGGGFLDSLNPQNWIIPTPSDSTVNAGLRHVPGVAQAEGVAGAVGSVGDFLGRITDPAYIIRGLQIIAGAGLVAGGLFLLAKQIGLASSVPGPVGTVAGAVE